MRKAILISLLSSVAVPAAAEMVTFTAGDHPDHSRVVFSSQNDQIGLAQKGRQITISLPEQTGGIDLSEIITEHRASRIENASATTSGTGTDITFTLNCDCEVRNRRLNDGRTILDIYDASDAGLMADASAPTPATPQKAASPSSMESHIKAILDDDGPTALTPPAAPSTPKKVADASHHNEEKEDEQEKHTATTPTKAKGQLDESLSVKAAHQRMLELLRQAADDGLITVKDEAKDLLPPSQKVAQADKVVVDAGDNDSNGMHAKSSSLSDHLKIAQDFRKPGKKMAGTRACLDDSLFFIDDSEFKEEPLVRISQLQNEMIYSDTVVQREIAQSLAHGFLSIGFGEEAYAVLHDFGKKNSLFSEIALAVSDRELSEKSSLRAAKECTGTHALWQAVIAEPKDAPALAEASQKAIETLPERLRLMIATRLAAKLLDAKDIKGAEQFYEVAEESTDQFSPELTLVKARLLEADGDHEEANENLLKVASENSPAAADALVMLGEKYADGESPHEGYLQDLGALAKVAQGSDYGAKAAILEAVGWAHEGNIEAAVLLLRSAARNNPSHADEAVKTARELIADHVVSDDEATQISALSAYLGHRSFVDAPDDDVVFRKKIAQSALAVGLPNVAYKVIEHNPHAQDQDYALLKTKAALKADAAEKALEIAAPYTQDPAFAKQVVEANLRLQRNYAALAAAAALPADDQKSVLMAQAAWRAGDWNSALRAFDAINPAILDETAAVQYALAAYKSGRPAIPVAAQAVLSKENSASLDGLERLFQSTPEGSVLARGKEVAQSASDELALIKEALGHG